MVTVHCKTTDKITAWRVRDMLACHPLLSGASADLDIAADHADVVISGWISHDHLSRVVGSLARKSAGRRTIQMAIGTKREAKEAD